MIDDGRPMYHLTLVSELHGNQVQNGYYFVPASAHSSPDIPTELFTIVERFNARVMPAIQAFSCDDLHFIALICATMIPRYGPIYERPFETGEGAIPNESLPSYCAGVLSLRTGFGGRSHRGRSYYSGVGTLDSERSRLTASGFTRLQGIGDALLGGFAASVADNEFHYGVYSKKLGDVAPPPPQAGKLMTLAGFQPITQTIARHEIYTQRHRLSGHGP